MARSRNAQRAVDMFGHLIATKQLDAKSAWKAIALLLLTCGVYEGKRTGWQRPFDECVIFRDSNDFVVNVDGDANKAVQDGRRLGRYLSLQLGVAETSICDVIGEYWRVPGISLLQPHNPVGHAFRSICVDYLTRFGDPSVTFEEEVDPYKEFPGFKFQGASQRPRIDIVARRNGQTVALISSKWRYRHDRVEFIEEFNRYLIAARRSNPECELYAMTGEFSSSRLHKALSASRPTSTHGPLSAVVHFAPQLLWDALGTNGRTHELKDLVWLANETHNWS